MGIIRSVVSDVVYGFARDAAVEGSIGLLGAPERFRDKHPKREKGKKKANIVQTPFSSKEFKGKQISDVKDALEQKGFKNIVLIPKRDLVLGLVTREGSIESVTIGGRNEFGQQAKFYEDDSVDIAYHAFR